jgi:hypothetical protein
VVVAAVVVAAVVVAAVVVAAVVVAAVVVTAVVVTAVVVTAVVVTAVVVTAVVVTAVVVTAARVVTVVVTVVVVPRVERGLVVHRRRAGSRLLRRAVDLRRVTLDRLLRRLAVVVVVMVVRLRVTRVVSRMDAATEEGKRFTLRQQFAELGIQLKQAKLRHYKSPSSLFLANFSAPPHGGYPGIKLLTSGQPYVLWISFAIRSAVQNPHHDDRG